ncbi:SpoIIE family protein phosphatase [Streptomyces sp. UH6]|uniref:SpoIIE family protein phosphatase n=1 Tax=Streptomyces sp. UH6 TaxID=2748379 RepID=UPI0015D5156C|nr:SpoIIE family protein phosphatase [Streptomyces sp. UH6]NYV75742.1 SpoIIE family protein phosphatase [Streptomyces sp. UH6]
MALLADADGVVRQCTDSVRDLTGRGRQEVVGRPLEELVVDPPRFAQWTGHDGPREFGAVLRHRDGHRVEVAASLVPLPRDDARPFLFLLVPAEHARRHRQGRDLARALLDQDRVGLILRDAAPENGWPLANPGFFGLPASAQGGRPCPALADALVDEDAEEIEARLREVMRTGEPLVDFEHAARRRGEPTVDRQVSVSAFRLHDSSRRPSGAAAVFIDITGQFVARQRLTLLHAVANRLGQSLDVTHNAEELASVLVPDFADHAYVDLSDTVLEGGDTAGLEPGTVLRRVAVATAAGPWPAEVLQPGGTLRVRDVESEALAAGAPVVVPDLAKLSDTGPVDRGRTQPLFPASAASALFVPLLARGHAFGVLGLWRGAGRQPYSAADVPLAEVITSRAALSLDNARRYRRERDTVETLQRSLLPAPDTRMSAAETAGVYAPAHTPAGTGGSWYDVVRLSGSRVAFVSGKVVGHGVHAAAAMGRLRSAVHALADLDLPPDELLSHLDDLVARLGENDRSEGPSVAGSLHGATCLYITYDPVTGECHAASAGNPGPVLARRRATSVPETVVRPGRWLGGGVGDPFATVELVLQPGDVLVLHSGPPAGAAQETAPESGRLRDSALAAARGDVPLPSVAEQLLRDLNRTPRPEDVALLLARVDRIRPERTAYWEFRADLDQASRARELVTAQLAEWGLDDMAFSTELIVSELVTNAIRHAGGPIGLRLIRDARLVCEVSDPSQAQPHLRRARMSDEGGRGLFLIAQLADRWGSRYTAGGKTIWTEQSYPSGTPGDAPADAER